MTEEETLEARVGFLVPLNKLPPERQFKLLEQSEVLKLKKKQTKLSHKHKMLSLLKRRQHLLILSRK